MDFLTGLEQSALATWIRESPSVWAYPTVLFLHTVGLGFLVGTSMVVTLRVLGVSPGIPLEPIKKLVPVMWVGFAINAASGVILTIIDASSMLVNPLFYIKLSFIGLAIVSGQFAMKRMARAFAGASLVFWIVAITAGRLTAYLFAHPGAVASLK